MSLKSILESQIKSTNIQIDRTATIKGAISEYNPLQASKFNRANSGTFRAQYFIYEGKNCFTVLDEFKGSTEEGFRANQTLILHDTNSLIYSVYENRDFNSPENFSTIEDLKAYLIPQNIFKKDASFDIIPFINALKVAYVKLNPNLPYRFVAALQTKPFLILTGLSGSGKTKLAEAFSLWISENKDQYQMVSVGADWTNREPLLGFPNALESGKYVKPDTGVLDLLIRAKDDKRRPYFLILDEMNMSHVERYFADFLSAMESAEGEITFHAYEDKITQCGVPKTMNLPKNLFIIGTVNVDETTYMFSPKVLDRANVIEFRVSEDEMKNFLINPKPLDMPSLIGQGALMGSSFVDAASTTLSVNTDLGAVLMPFFKELQKVGAEFGYRTASEMSQFISQCKSLVKGAMTDDQIIDAAIIQKLLPKLHGSRNKIEKVLTILCELCLNTKIDNVFDANGDQVKYALSYEKLKRMHSRVLSDGFTSFAEA